MNSINLLKSLESLLTEPVAQQAPTFLGESRAAVIRGLDTSLSNVLGAVMRHSTTPADSERLLRVLRMPNIDLTLLTRDLSGMFAGGEATNNLIHSGNASLGLLFGQKIHGFNDALAGISGLASNNAALLTAMVTPFVLAAIKHAATEVGPLEAASLGTVVDSQALHLKGRISEKLLGTLGIGGIATWLGSESRDVRDEVHAIGAGAKQAVVATEREVAERKSKWLWIGLLLLALLALLSLGYCMKHTSDDDEPPEVTASAPSVASAATAVADAIPKGAGIIAAMMEGKPALKVYFDYGKSALSSDFADKAKDVLTYLKDNPSSKASVSGFTDSSGDPTLNAALAKKRAESVQAALQAAGLDTSRISLDKPVELNGSTPDAKDRRVEIHVQ
ncbi:DUF937 domain-containing protein [Burkholderia stagnalis]